MQCSIVLALATALVVHAKFNDCKPRSRNGFCETEQSIVELEKRDLLKPRIASIEEYCDAASKLIICTASSLRGCKSMPDSKMMRTLSTLPKPNTGSKRVDRAVQLSSHSECIRMRGLLREFLGNWNSKF